MQNNDEIKATGEEFKEKIREKGETFAGCGKNIFQSELGSLSDAFHCAAEKLREKDNYFAPLGEVMVDKIDSMSNYVKEHKPDEIVKDINDYSKHNPYVAMGAMFIGGLALSRFLKV